ncbi:beta-defensin 52 precursor [Rattus norvegicus]|uniref:Beta-defensin 52 n=1 Tax=Rattus norvegicus TaxID=10116 RepID=Q30KJ1_RAT|nr:beta-defensin 52 precursor [Rattus norvegicus]AAY59819.1 beta-defensin 52 [Rattus norvegicus]|eukprot:NP_001032613.1 beta-defensin 52 precursor [Rattus norvegicus]
MKLLYLLISVVLLISQVMAAPEGCKQEGQTEWKDFVRTKGAFIHFFNNDYGHHYCDSPTSVCLRRRTNCTRMPGLCPGRSFCCVRT